MAAAKRKTSRATKTAPVIGIVMGSQSDFSVMQQASKILKEFGVAHETKIVSAHRTPKRLVEYAETASDRGLKAIIAGAGGAAHLPGMIASLTSVPVLGVPVPTTALNGIDSLYSIVQMPKGVPVATFAVGEHGAINAALFAIATLAQYDAKLYKKLTAFRQKQTKSVPDAPKGVR